MIFHSEILNKNQSDLLPSLGAFASKNGFYLGGGTSVALQFGHRMSIDFDWFTQGPMGDPLALAEHARQVGLKISNTQIASGTLHAIINKVRVSFFEYPYVSIGEPSIWPDSHVTLALRHKPITDLLSLYQRKYDTTDIAHVLLGLTYFDDADAEPSPVMMENLPWDKIKQQFLHWAIELADK